MLNADEITATVRKFARVAYADAPASSDVETIAAAVAAVDAQVDQASAAWLAAMPGQFAEEATTDQKRALIACVVAARNGLE